MTAKTMRGRFSSLYCLPVRDGFDSVYSGMQTVLPYQAYRAASMSSCQWLCVEGAVRQATSRRRRVFDYFLLSKSNAPPRRGAAKVCGVMANRSLVSSG